MGGFVVLVRRLQFTFTRALLQIDARKMNDEDGGAFYLTLPSNSSLEHFPENSPSHYHTKLARTLYLKGDYEVGLAEIMFPNNYSNVEEGECTIMFRIDSGKKIHFAKMKSGLYDDPFIFIDALNEMTSAAEEQGHIKFKYDPMTKRVTMRLRKIGTQIRFSHALKKMLNFNQWAHRGGGGGGTEIIADGPIDLARDHEAVYVYCDLVEERIVGDATVPLLRTIPLVDKRLAVVHHVYPKPHFVKLSKQSFETVEMLLSRDTGEEISFGRGKCVVTLEIRKRQPRF